MSRLPGTLVVLPGWGGSRESWSQFSEAYQGKGDLLVIDLPCFGDEPCPEVVWGIDDYVAFVLAALRDIHGTIHLLGHSFGGQVAAKLAADYPNMISTLTLIGAAAIRPRRTVKRFVFKLLAVIGKMVFSLPGLRTLAPFSRQVLYRLADSPDYQDTSGIKREIYRRILREDLHNSLETIRIPTLILWGARDTYTPLEQGREIARLVSESTLVILSDGTHGLHHGETIIPMIEALTTFIRKHS